MSRPLVVVVPLQNGLPATFPSTLEKVLSGAVLTEESLLLPLDSIQLVLSGGTQLSMMELERWLLPLAGGSIGVSRLPREMRGFFRAR